MFIDGREMMDGNAPRTKTATRRAVARNMDLNSNRAWPASTSVCASQVGRTAKRPSAPKERVMRRAIGCALAVQFATREESKLRRGLRPGAGVVEVIVVKDPEGVDDAGGLCASCVDVVVVVVVDVVGRWPGIASQREGGKKRGRESAGQRSPFSPYSLQCSPSKPLPPGQPVPTLRPPPSLPPRPIIVWPSVLTALHSQRLLSPLTRHVFCATNALEWALQPATR